MTKTMTEMEIEEVIEQCDQAIAEVDRLRAELGHVEPAEEPDVMTEVRADGHRCEYCCATMPAGTPVAVFMEDDRSVVMHAGPCPEPPLVTRTIVSRRLSEPHEVEAMTRGVWAAHRDPAGPSRILVEPWIVTHIPTGMHVLVMPLRREEAIAIVERLGMMRPTGPRDLDILSVVSEVIRG